MIFVALYKSRLKTPPVEVSMTAGLEYSAELFLGIITESTPKKDALLKQEPKFLVS